MNMERLSNGLAAGSAALGDYINYRGKKEMAAAQAAMDEQMERLRQSNRIAVLEKGATLDEATDNRRNLFTTSRDETLNEYELGRIKETGRQNRSTAYLTAAMKNGGGGLSGEDKTKLLKRWNDEINTVRTAIAKNELMLDDDQERELFIRYVNQAAMESGYDADIVRQVALSANFTPEQANAMANTAAAARGGPQTSAPPGSPSSPSPGGAGDPTPVSDNLGTARDMVETPQPDPVQRPGFTQMGGAGGTLQRDADGRVVGSTPSAQQLFAQEPADTTPDSRMARRQAMQGDGRTQLRALYEDQYLPWLTEPRRPSSRPGTATAPSPGIEQLPNRDESGYVWPEGSRVRLF